MESVYWIQILAERRFDFDGVPCLLGLFDCPNAPGVVRASWVLSDDGKVVARGISDEAQGMLGGTETMGREIGTFDAKKGAHYVLDVDVLEDGSRLNAGHPRLQIVELGGLDREYESWHIADFWVPFFLLAGAALLIGSIIQQRTERRSADALVSIGETLHSPLPSTESDVAQNRPSIGPSFIESVSLSSRIPLAWRFGIALIVVGSGLLICSIHWLAPHQRVALDIPVSLSPGRITTGNFRVQPDALYQLDIELTRPIPAGCDPHSVLSTQSTLSVDGKIERQGFSPWEDSGLIISDLLGENRQYSFDVQIFPGASCLNAGNPRLKVRTHPEASEVYTDLIWLSLWSIMTGFVLPIQFWYREVFAEKPSLRIFPGMVIRNVLPVRKHRPIPLMKDFPNFGLILGCILFIVMFLSMITFRRSPQGLLVNFGKPSAVQWDTSPWRETLGVYVDDLGQLYVNRQRVTKQDLAARLKEELGKLMVWTVYFEANEKTRFADAVCAMETIQRSGAKLVWITPQIRLELNRKPAK